VSYRIEVDDRARREIIRLPKSVIARIRDTVVALARDPRAPGAKRLTGREGYRVRVGDYRILYDIDDRSRLVRIYKVGHRQGIDRR
jgi:mRNA interferase RelE/StbE